jgi:predicted nucleic acid-binding protein
LGLNRKGLTKRLDGHRILLDSSSLIAYLNRAEETHAVAAFLIDDLVRNGHDPAVISPVSAMEILVVPLRQGPAHAVTVHDFIQNWPNLSLIDIDLRVAQEAASLRAMHGFRTPDALVIATGLIAQVGHLVTNDRSWRVKLAPIKNRVAVTMLTDYLT